MARWMAIVALLLGMGFTAYDAFSTPPRGDEPARVQTMEDGTGFPPPPSGLLEDGTGFPPPTPDMNQ